MVDRVPHNENRRNCALVDQFAHKTEGVNRTQNMRFYPPPVAADVLICVRFVI